jgi:glutamine---fructose-6-phosphate transaminase (isomerizing)
VKYVLIASRGSSSNAARYAQYLLGRAHRVPVMFATPSLYTIYEQPPRLDGAAVIGISQSGASPDVSSVLAEARRQKRPTIAITNNIVSPLARTMPEILERQLALSRESAPLLDEYSGAIGATIVGRGVNYGTAFEVALKIRELSGLVVEAYSPADLMHGPIAAIQPGWPVMLVAPSGPARPSVEDVVLPLRERGARLVAISDVSAVLRRAQTRLPLVPHVPEWLSPLTAVIPGQLTALRLAQLRGLDIDAPVGLNKVTLTR